MAGRHIAGIKVVSAGLILLVYLTMALQADEAAKKYKKSEIDELLAMVWRISEIDLSNFRDYVFREKEIHDCKLLGGSWEGCRQVTGQIPESYRYEYAWFVRDGYFVRSLITNNGVEVSSEQQKASEDEWIQSERRRGNPQNVLEYFLENSKHFGGPAITKLMKEGKYKYKGEELLEGRRVIALKANYSAPLGLSFTLLIAPEDNHLVQFEQELKSFYIKGKYFMLMEKVIDKSWLPTKCSGIFEADLPSVSQISYYRPSCHYVSVISREFYSFKKSEVKAKFWFEGADAGITKDAGKPQSE